MKWKLITGDGINPGDFLIVEGCKRLIKEVDKDASFELFLKESIDPDGDPYILQDYDKAVWCGTATFWSFGEWGGLKYRFYKNFLCHWPKERKDDLLILGAGIVDTIYPADIFDQIKVASDRAFHVQCRCNIPIGIYNAENISVSMCPGIFPTWQQHAETRDNDYINLMSNGGHWAEDLAPDIAKYWRLVKLPMLVKQFCNQRLFVAHNEAEYQFAQQLGWKEEYIRWPKNADDMIAIYGKARSYIGNRVHGAIASLGAFAEVLWYGFDLRGYEVAMCGGTALKLNDELMCNSSQYYCLRDEWDKQVELVRRFAEA